MRGRKDRDETTVGGLDERIGGSDAADERAGASEPSASSGDGFSEVDELGEEALRQQICADLAKVGLLGEEAKRVSEAMLEQLRLTGPAGYDDLLAGIRFSHQARCDVATDLGRMQRELKQLERLMGGFATELRKLDEVLEVLAAYVRRMRSVGDSDNQMLH